MKLEVPEIYWHGNKERIMSLDFFPFVNSIEELRNKIILVTGGTDTELKEGFIKQWEINPDEFGTIEIDENVKELRFVKFIGNLIGHKSTVNCVKFSPNGQYLASASDDKEIIIWEMKQKFTKFGSNETELGFTQQKQLFGHSGDVYDLQWSKNSQYLVTGGIDNTAILWSAKTFKAIQTFDGHSNYVQGVCIDPFMKFILTQSVDRSVKVWKKRKMNKKVEYYHAYVILQLSYFLMILKKQISKFLIIFLNINKNAKLS